MSLNTATTGSPSDQARDGRREVGFSSPPTGAEFAESRRILTNKHTTIAPPPATARIQTSDDFMPSPALKTSHLDRGPACWRAASIPLLNV
jgi:hypothetical protein